MITDSSNESQNMEVYTVQDQPGQIAVTSNIPSFTNTVYGTPQPTINQSGNLCQPNISTSASVASLNPQLEVFSNSIGSGTSYLQCVNPTDVHVDGYLSPTPSKTSAEVRNVSPYQDRPTSTEIQPQLPSISRSNLKSILPSNIDCSTVDFTSVNEELLSPANFSTHDKISIGRMSSSNTKIGPRTSSPKDIPVFSIPDPLIRTSTDEGSVLHSPMKTESAGQKFIDMGVEFHMMLQKQSMLKKQATSLRHHDRLVPISTESNDDGGDEEDDDEIVDNFNWDKLL